jgi:hypothetical protein
MSDGDYGAGHYGVGVYGYGEVTTGGGGGSPPTYPSPDTFFITDNVGHTLDLTQWPANGIAISKRDLGAPTVREVIYDLSSQDGSDDQTRYLSQRVVALTGKCFNVPGRSRSAAWLLMQPFLNPQARCSLTFQLDNDVVPLELHNLRVSQYSKVASSPTGFDFSVQWKCDPVAFDLIQQSATTQPIGSTGLGRSYPLSYNRQWPVSVVGSPLVIVSNGTYRTWPLYRINGPCINPVVSIVDNVSFTPIGQFRLLMTIAAGSYVEVDSAARTVMLGGPTGSSRYNTLDFANLDWEPLQPGTNTLEFSAPSSSAGCQCTILWNDAYMA